MTHSSTTTTPARLRAGIAVAVLVSLVLLALAVTVALIGGREPEVAGSFVLVFTALLLLAGAAIGAVRLKHGDDPEVVDLSAAKAMSRQLFAALAVLGTFAVVFVAILTPFPHSLIAVIPLAMVAVLARGALGHDQGGL